MESQLVVTPSSLQCQQQDDARQASSTRGREVDRRMATPGRQHYHWDCDRLNHCSRARLAVPTADLVVKRRIQSSSRSRTTLKRPVEFVEGNEGI
ncbi:hypothetical protein M407DRAFT_242209 [Tulasnella calospora MUT 4182]|uniref:Uncharacterized protein n=1 Tax=Tulasnella calospora MUT 4182 TaxID=1051891 RepID=A0A0C3QRM4_9AGAM|nr:hypothetical protein M407DRAFT_242209 [Tulasnella calospora MUT 4182]